MNHKERLNPRNGLCLNSIHDQAFDKGFITITTDYKIRTSKYLQDLDGEAAVNDFFLRHSNQKINLPDRFLPEIEFLNFHAENIFKN
jgi:putative restriction endonuclease